jgi:hypothetical protein
MSRLFIACKGKTACQENEMECRTCGRSVDEIYRTRALIDELANFAQSMGYENSDTFLEYVANKAAKKIHYLQQEAENTHTANYDYH